MGKIVNPSHTTSRRGVDSFALYCSCHKPQILWREETVNDFGVDGEIELTAKNQDGKVEATGEILKIQIKATSSYNSYMKNETQRKFEFIAREEDLEYWSKHKLDVVLIIFDDKEEKLYAKKITETDYKLQTNKSKSYPITFDKTGNLLQKGETDFLTKFSLHPRARLSFDNPETLSTNIFKIKDIPREIYAFPAKFADAMEVYNNLQKGDYPTFVLYAQTVFTFSDLKHFPKFKENCVDFGNKKSLPYSYIQNDIDIRNHFVELLKKYFKEYFYSKRIFYNKDYLRYYFGKLENQDTRKEKHKTRKREQEGERTVVAKYTYGRDTFFKHLAFEIDFIFKGSLFLVINPKYLFTLDGKETLEPKKITQYTNYLTNREYNGHVLDSVHFYFDLFSNDKSVIEISNNDGISFCLTKYLQIPAKFSIPTDSKQFKRKVEDPHFEQMAQTSLEF